MGTIIDILPCPFCGAPASIEEVPSLSGVAFTVGCNSDTEKDCMGYQSLTVFNTRGQAVTAWNRRVREDYLQNRLDHLTARIRGHMEALRPLLGEWDEINKSEEKK